MVNIQNFCKSLVITIIFVSAFVTNHALGEGFIAGTLVKTPSGYVEIETIQKGDRVICYDFLGKCTETTVIDQVQTHDTSYIEIKILDEIVYVAPDHKFYLPITQTWVAARDLLPGHILLKHCSDLVIIDRVTEINMDADFYDLTIADHHNFCVSKHDIHVHNFLPALGLTITWLIGEGIVVTGTAAVGGLAVGAALWSNSDDAKKEAIYQNMERNIANHQNEKMSGHNQKPKNFEEDRAPGKPTDKDGWFPPKKWDGKKIPSPNGPGYGYPDKDGGVWIPAGPDAHRGPHWDVEYPNGGYKNVMPGGKVLGGKGKTQWKK